MRFRRGVANCHLPPAVERNGVKEYGGKVVVGGRWSSILGKEVVYIQELSREC